MRFFSSPIICKITSQIKPVNQQSISFNSAITTLHYQNHSQFTPSKSVSTTALHLSLFTKSSRFTIEWRKEKGKKSSRFMDLSPPSSYFSLEVIYKCFPFTNLNLSFHTLPLFFQQQSITKSKKGRIGCSFTIHKIKGIHFSLPTPIPFHTSAFHVNTRLNSQPNRQPESIQIKETNFNFTKINIRTYLGANRGGSVSHQMANSSGGGSTAATACDDGGNWRAAAAGTHEPQRRRILAGAEPGTSARGRKQRQRDPCHGTEELAVLLWKPAVGENQRGREFREGRLRVSPKLL